MKKFFSVIISVIICMILLTSLTGCWDKKEINERMYVVGMGVDKSDKGETLFDYTFQIAMPKGSDRAMDTNDIEYTVSTVVTDSSAQAVRSLEKNMSIDVNFEHLACIVIGDNLKEEDFAKRLEYLFRSSAARRQCVVVAASKSARELLEAEPEGGNMSLSIASLMEKQDDSHSHGATMTLQKLYRAAYSHQGFFLHRIAAESGGSTNGYNISTELSSSSDTQDKSTLIIEGQNIYTSQGYAGSFDSRISELSRLFFGTQRSGVITAADENGKSLVYKIDTSACKKNCYIENSSPRFVINLDVHCSLIDSLGANTVAEAKAAEKAISESLHSQLSEITDGCTLMGAAAPIGLEDTARQQCHKWYNENKSMWNELFSKSEIELNITCELEQTGSIR